MNHLHGAQRGPSQVSRRGFLRFAAAGALAGSAIPMLQACAPAAPSAVGSTSAPGGAQPGATAGSGSSRPSLLPKYAAVTRWAIGNFGTNANLFGLSGYAEMFNAPDKRSRDGFVAKKFAVSVEGQGNSWIDFWQRGLPGEGVGNNRRRPGPKGIQ